MKQDSRASATGAAKAIGLVLPALDGRLDGMAVRVPTPNVSLVDLHFIAKRDTSVEEVNALMSTAAEASPVLNINEKPLVSIDFNHNSASSIYDKKQTRVNGRMVKVMMWYDNEWGFSNRMLDTAGAMHASAHGAKSSHKPLLASA
jgi:glyceraldehyde 3-phosphate dehydrogenase